MTPADLAELLKTTAAAVLAEHGARRCRAAARRSPWSGHATPSTAITPATWRCSWARRSAPTRASWPDGSPRRWPKPTASPRRRWPDPASSTCASTPRRRPSIVNNVIDAGARFGNSDAQAGHHINLEFVSANPTGPIHIGGTRWAAVGDALGRLLTTQGADVVREYYFNDHGAQIDRFANSLIAAAKGEPTPEDGYAGSYIADIAAQVLQQAPDALSLPDAEQHETFREIGVDLMFTHIKKSLHEFGIDFDVYTHEDSMHTSGRVEQAIARAARERQHLREGRRNLVAHQRFWRRQGPRRHQERRQARLHRGRSRLLPGQARSAVSTCVSTCSAPTTTATSPD